MILKAIYNYFFLLHSIVVCYFCSASRLIVCQIPSAVLSFRRGVVFIVVHDTKIRFVYHFLISLHIGSSACVLHMFREVCIFIMLKQTTDNKRGIEQTKSYKRANSLLDTQIQKTQSEKIGTSQKTYKQFS